MIIRSISYSSDKKLSRCEMQFNYRYGEGLAAKVKKIGLYRGDWIHQLLQAYYLKRANQGKGWQDKLKELREKSWKPLFDEEKEEYGLDFPDTIEELLEHYTEHWSGWDKNWEILHVEKRFELMTKLGYPLRWQADLIVKETETVSNVRRIRGHGNTFTLLVETKAKKAIPDSSERILQPQTHSYCYLLGKVGIPIQSILWNYIRTEPVPRPKINKDGSLSIRKIDTDRRGYMKSLQEAGITAESATDWQGIENHIQSLPETLSLERITNTVNLKLGEKFVRDWVERHRRALGIKRPLRAWGRNCKWDCDYYKLCQVDMVEKTDRNLVILKDFTRREEREENPNK